MTSKCVISLDLPEDIVAPLGDHFDLLTWSGREAMPEVTLQEWLADAEGLLCALSTPITASVIAGAEHLKVISTISVGVDHIDLAAATAAGIPVGHTPGVLVDSTADLAVGLMIAATRRIAEADRWIRTGQWSQGWQSDLLLGTDLSQATVGIVGLGPIGEATVKRLSGFGAPAGVGALFAAADRGDPLACLCAHSGIPVGASFRGALSRPRCLLWRGESAPSPAGWGIDSALRVFGQ